MPLLFSRYELRTKDPDGARAFYADVLPGVDLEITQLPAPAAARGAPSHWLGHVAGDVERALASGAQRIAGNVLRDPLGAVFAVTNERSTPTAPVVWHQLNTTSIERATRFYRESFDWPPDANVVITDLAATQPGVHTAWLFHFAVADLDETIAKVKSQGGLVAGVFAIPGTKDRIAVCDDPQGAFVAFRQGQVFPDRYHRRDLGTPTEVRHVLSYVLNNARKHVRHIGNVAYVDASTSGEGFDGWSEPVERFRWVDDEAEPWPQVRCWTWLLRVGWRKRGLISPFAVPGAKRQRPRAMRTPFLRTSKRCALSFAFFASASSALNSATRSFGRPARTRVSCSAQNGSQSQ